MNLYTFLPVILRIDPRTLSVFRETSLFGGSRDVGQHVVQAVASLPHRWASGFSWSIITFEEQPVVIQVI